MRRACDPRSTRVPDRRRPVHRSAEERGPHGVLRRLPGPPRATERHAAPAPEPRWPGRSRRPPKRVTTPTDLGARRLWPTTNSYRDALRVVHALEENGAEVSLPRIRQNDNDGLTL